jgi:hypothetical protein
MQQADIGFRTDFSGEAKAAINGQLRAVWTNANASAKKEFRLPRDAN